MSLSTVFHKLHQGSETIFYLSVPLQGLTSTAKIYIKDHKREL